MTAAPRTVEICLLTGDCTSPYDYQYYPDYFSSHTPSPAVLHACREARQWSPYQKAFLSILLGESSPRYIWVNFQRDLISVPDYTVECLAPHEHEIQRLRVTTPLDGRGNAFHDTFYDYYFHPGNLMMEEFTAIRELQIAIRNNFVQWGHTVYHPLYGACPSAGIRFLDRKTGLLLTASQLAMASTWYQENGGKVKNLDNLDYEVHDCHGFHLSQLAEIE